MLYLFCVFYFFVNACSASSLPHGGAVVAADYCSKVTKFRFNETFSVNVRTQ